MRATVQSTHIIQEPVPADQLTILMTFSSKQEMHTPNPFTLMEHLATQTRPISQHYHHPMYHTLQHGVSTTVYTPIHHPRSDATQQSKDPLANHKLFTWSLHTTVFSHTRI